LPRPQSMEDLRLTEDPLDVNAAFAFVTEPATGATSIFVGTTRWAMHCNIYYDFLIIFRVLSIYITQRRIELVVSPLSSPEKFAVSLK